ncbi:FixH family protein [Fredinandcohnia sp. FSL W7-1320]|uniref:FixH family protein n=1 Tax=Fredinandcohnia sp. FSL W7-1320 TaxID=2954540 RepID=UPI0030FD53C6
MKKIGLFLFLAAIIMLAACNNETEKKNTNTTELVPIAVDLKLDPEKINPGEEVTLHATVTQGEETVEDADEVQFEIAQKGSEESEFLDGEHTSDGEYTAVKTFEQDGIYFVTAHVTARSMHTMPKVEVVIGNPSVTEESADEPAEHGDHHGNEHHHGSGDVSIDFPLETEYPVGKSSTLHVSFEESGAPLTDAKVRFEVWKDGAEKHEFIDANETENGVYQSDFTFTESGNYNIQVHIEKGEIHEHLEKTTNVK